MSILKHRHVRHGQDRVGRRIVQIELGGIDELGDQIDDATALLAQEMAATRATVVDMAHEGMAEARRLHAETQRGAYAIGLRSPPRA